MRILQLGKFYPVRGGVEKVMYDLMLGLADRGIECDMMCAESSGKGNIHKIDARAKILTYHTWAKVASTTIAPSMINALRAVADKYDIIHVHHPDPMAALALMLSGFKGSVVLHWHADILKSKSLLKLYKGIQQWLLERADVIVTTSPVTIYNSDDLEAYRGKTVCIPIGIAGLEMDTAGAAKLRNKFGDRKMVFSLGRLVPYKGFKYLVNGAKYLPDNYVVVIGGEGPLLGELEQLRDSLGIHDKVFFVGRIPDEDLPAYYTACDIFCLPSVMKPEAFGIVQIEAMSLGKPVVATTIPGSGTAWVNKHGFSGLNVNPADAEALAQALHAIGSNDKKYALFSDGAKDRFEEEFKLDQMVDRCYELYRDTQLIAN